MFVYRNEHFSTKQFHPSLCDTAHAQNGRVKLTLHTTVEEVNPYLNAGRTSVTGKRRCVKDAEGR